RVPNWVPLLPQQLANTFSASSTAGTSLAFNISTSRSSLFWGLCVVRYVANYQVESDGRLAMPHRPASLDVLG
ncbi:MAG TPA: hypothetical protein VKC99_02750, partial [Methyloceanibacter sp.]|nr:hypothetical protein [Methyloceanibacter sp.]